MTDTPTRDELVRQIIADLDDFLVAPAAFTTLGHGSKRDYHIAVTRHGDPPYELWLDLISVHEGLRSQGIFTDVLRHIEQRSSIGQICVGNLQNRRFRDFFLRRGYTLQGDRHVWRYPPAVPLQRSSWGSSAARVTHDRWWSSVMRWLRQAILRAR